MIPSCPLPLIAPLLVPLASRSTMFAAQLPAASSVVLRFCVVPAASLPVRGVGQTAKAETALPNKKLAASKIFLIGSLQDRAEDCTRFETSPWIPSNIRMGEVHCPRCFYSTQCRYRRRWTARRRHFQTRSATERRISWTYAPTAVIQLWMTLYRASSIPCIEPPHAAKASCRVENVGTEPFAPQIQAEFTGSATDAVELSVPA